MIVLVSLALNSYDFEPNFKIKGAVWLLKVVISQIDKSSVSPITSKISSASVELSSVSFVLLSPNREYDVIVMKASKEL